jgi:hypothetical protein
MQPLFILPRSGCAFLLRSPLPYSLTMTSFTDLAYASLDCSILHLLYTKLHQFAQEPEYRRSTDKAARWPPHSTPLFELLETRLCMPFLIDRSETCTSKIDRVGVPRIRASPVYLTTLQVPSITSATSQPSPPKSTRLRKQPSPNRGRTRYDNVNVSLMRWEQDELRLEPEVHRLDQKFQDYGFKTDRRLIPTRDSHLEL